MTMTMMEKTGDVPLLLTLSFKRCPCCGQVKPTTEFTRRKLSSGRWGFQAYCRKCDNERAREYRRNNLEKRKILERKADIKKYGLKIEDLDRMVKKQDYKCAICSEDLVLFGESKDKNKIAHVDHNHDTGEVRGLLCDKCNRGLGYFRDNPEYLLSAISYLKKTK